MLWALTFGEAECPCALQRIRRAWRVWSRSRISAGL